MESYIKVYTKILENPKVGRLDDKTWRIMMELFLVAGETFDDGKLPDVESLAWKLRRSEKEIASALSKLASIGTVTLSNDNAYDNAVITNFVRYQNTNQTAYERVKNWRNRQKGISGDNADDNVNDNASDNADDIETITTDRDIDKDIDINSLPDGRELGTRAKKAAQKHQHGSFRNVLLTDEELTKLRERFPDANERIEDFSKKKAAKGYVYKSDYAAILSWAERDAKAPKAKVSNLPKKKTFAELADEMMAAEAPESPVWDIDL